MIKNYKIFESHLNRQNVIDAFDSAIYHNNESKINDLIRTIPHLSNNGEFLYIASFL